jgi:hypothetical protein
MTISAKEDISQDEILDNLVKFAETNDYLVGGGLQESGEEDIFDKKYTESQLRDAIRNTITYLATLSETGKFHSGNIIEEAIIQSLNKQD